MVEGTRPTCPAIAGKTLAVLLSAALCAYGLPLALAGQAGATVTASATQVASCGASSATSDAISVDGDDSLLADADELADGYITRAFYGDDASATSTTSEDSSTSSETSSTLSTLANYGASTLDGDDLTLYEALKDDVATVAESGGSTIFTVDFSDKGSYTAVDEEFAENWSSYTSSSELAAYAKTVAATIAAEAFSSFFSDLDLTLVYNTLLVDCPYELYWFDKTTGVTYGYTYSYTPYTDGTFVIESMKLKFWFAVSDDYADSSTTYCVDADLAASVQTAVANAQAIVSEYSSVANVSKRLTAYKDEICELAGYNSSASSSSYGDAWQLVYVFDGDSATNVVCEGYSKAFQYLCDLTWPTGDEIVCYTVTGLLSGTEEHMWNLIQVADADADGYGEGSWLCDLTNSDTGTAGEGSGLFLSPATGGSVSTSYTMTAVSASGSTQAVTYAYDSTATSLYTTDILTLATSDFPDGLHHIDGADVALSSYSYTYDGTAHEPTVTVTYDGEELVEGGDFEVSYADNVNAGTATATVTGLDSWTGTAEATFTIEKATQGISLATSADDVAALGTLHEGSTLSNPLAGAQGDVEYASSDTGVAEVDADGTVTITGGGTATITATALATDNYEAASASYDVTGSAHSYTTDPTWEFADDYSSATATFTCDVDGCGQTVACETTDISSVTVTEATATSGGLVAWTATLTFGGTEWTATAYEETAALGDSSGDGDSADDGDADSGDADADSDSSDADSSDSGDSTDSADAGDSADSGDSTDSAGSGDAEADSGSAGVSKAANTIVVKARTVTVKGKTRDGVLKKNVALTAAQVVKVKAAQGKVTYAKVGSAGKSKIKVSKKGRVTLKKGLASGKYKLKLKVTAAGTDGYEAATKTVTVTIKVK